MTGLLEDPERFIGYGRTDWYVSRSWNRLHFVWPEMFLTEHRASIAMGWAVWTPIRLTCGRTAAGLYIPGMFSRLSLPRCKGCCRATGMAEGIGSPRNDDRCRRILGLS